MKAPYPEAAAARERWILRRRPRRHLLDPAVPHGFFTEEEPSGAGAAVTVATILLTNRECPWRCLMCDLWKNTLGKSVPKGAIPGQIRHALGSLPPARRVKLYNAGSFFDRRAIPPGDLPEIAELVKRFDRVIVECHPALVGDSCVRFRDALGSSRLEVALGLETVHADVLERLNKRMTTESFARAAAFLGAEGIALRVFVLVGLPFLGEPEGLEWTVKSVAFAFACGAEVVSLVPVRGGNGAMDALQARGEFIPPTLATVERTAAAGLAVSRGFVLTDLWELDRFSRCPVCFTERAERLRFMNLQQTVPPAVACDACGGSA
jgi:radical SAM enzyme (TIGR01210 family)